MGARAPVRARPAVDTRATAWVVSPHLLVAQAVTAALLGRERVRAVPWEAVGWDLVARTPLHGS